MEAESMPTDASILFTWRRLSDPELNLSLKSLEFMMLLIFCLTVVEQSWGIDPGFNVDRRHPGTDSSGTTMAYLQNHLS